MKFLNALDPQTFLWHEIFYTLNVTDQVTPMLLWINFEIKLFVDQKLLKVDSFNKLVDKVYEIGWIQKFKNEVPGFFLLNFFDFCQWTEN